MEPDLRTSSDPGVFERAIANGKYGPWIRYAIAFLGPVSTAGANFLLSLVLLRVMTADVFGHFSFLLILSQFSTGIWSALFSAVLPVIMADPDIDAGRWRLATLFSANLVSMLVAIPMFVSIGFALPAA